MVPTRALVCLWGSSQQTCARRTTLTCTLHNLSARKLARRMQAGHQGTTLVVRIETLHPKVGRRVPVCVPCLHQHTGARRSTLGCNLWPQGANAVPFMTVACASHVLVCGKGSTNVLGLFVGCKPIVRTPTNALVPELEPCEAVPMPNRQPMPTRA